VAGLTTLLGKPVEITETFLTRSTEDFNRAGIKVWHFESFDAAWKVTHAPCFCSALQGALGNCNTTCTYDYYWGDSESDASACQDYIENLSDEEGGVADKAKRAAREAARGFDVVAAAARLQEFVDQEEDMFAFEPAEKHSQVAAIVSQEQGRQRKGAAEGVGLGPAGMEMRPPAPEPWRLAPSQPRPLPEGAIQVKGSRAARARELLLLQHQSPLCLVDV
ncbi:hypothetical protein HaLaN_10274, partial [Haematococcus lacustris]